VWLTTSLLVISEKMFFPVDKDMISGSILFPTNDILMVGIKIRVSHKVCPDVRNSGRLTRIETCSKIIVVTPNFFVLIEKLLDLKLTVLSMNKPRIE